MRFCDDLDKFIERLSASKHANPECQKDRKQLKEWLLELKAYREKQNTKQNVVFSKPNGTYCIPKIN